jgi:hypothetical protein
MIRPFALFTLLLSLFAFHAFPTSAWHSILKDNVKSLEVMVNHDFMALPVMQLRSRDVLTISFDELSHNYHRFVYHLEPCNPDWTPVEGLFESDWLEGFNDQPIDNYENSLNTNVLYTHYQLQLPNAQTRLRMSGNYRLYILDEDDGNEEVACVEFRVVEPLMNVGIGVTTNTDIDFQMGHQQVALTVNYNTVKVTNHAEQLQVFVMQNGREDNMKVHPRPNYITPQSLRWEHNRELIFEAGNEYGKFEVLDPSHISMGLASVSWDEEQRRYHAFAYPRDIRRSYLYDEDADGAFLLRNSDNYEAATTSEYVLVHYKQKARYYDDARVIIDGRWTTEDPETYVMDYDETDGTYNAIILQKLGYYNYQLLLQDYDGTTHLLPEMGSFYQTENRYQGLVYYKGTGERAWRLVGYQEILFRDN